MQLKFQCAKPHNMGVLKTEMKRRYENHYCSDKQRGDPDLTPVNS